MLYKPHDTTSVMTESNMNRVRNQRWKMFQCLLLVNEEKLMRCAGVHTTCTPAHWWNSTITADPWTVARWNVCRNSGQTVDILYHTDCLLKVERQIIACIWRTVALLQRTHHRPAVWEYYNPFRRRMAPHHSPLPLGEQHLEVSYDSLQSLSKRWVCQDSTITFICLFLF